MLILIYFAEAYALIRKTQGPFLAASKKIGLEVYAGKTK
jgi:hypothetical protein